MKTNMKCQFLQKNFIVKKINIWKVLRFASCVKLGDQKNLLGNISLPFKFHKFRKKSVKAIGCESF